MWILGGGGNRKIRSNIETNELLDRYKWVYLLNVVRTTYYNHYQQHFVLMIWLHGRIYSEFRIIFNGDEEKQILSLSSVEIIDEAEKNQNTELSVIGI